MGDDVIGVYEDRLVLVSADLNVFEVLSGVHGEVLVPDTGPGDLLRVTCKLRQGSDLHEWVLHGVVGDWYADHTPESRPPYSGTGDYVLSLYVAFIGDDGVDATVPSLDVRNLGLTVKFCAKGSGGVGHGFVGAYAFDQAIGRIVHGPQDLVGEEGEHVPGLLGGDNLSFEAPGLAKTDLALELLQALGGPGDLQTADLVVGTLSIDFK